ncbi:MAG: DUF5788 family protein [Halobacteriota archaeon]|nr:DUF5788 family protein [Halobacteriota archaeon]
MISEKDKKDLIEKLSKPSSLVGKDIPDEIFLDDEKLELSGIVLDLIKKEVVSDYDLKFARELKRKLLKKQADEETYLKDSDLTEEEANILYEEILGIKRAILALEGVGKEAKDLKNVYQSDDIEDMKRWIKFLKKVR